MSKFIYTRLLQRTNNVTINFTEITFEVAENMTEENFDKEPSDAASAQLTRNDPATEQLATVSYHLITKSRLRGCFFNIKDVIMFEVFYCLVLLPPLYGFFKSCK